VNLGLGVIGVFSSNQDWPPGSESRGSAAQVLDHLRSNVERTLLAFIKS
jgi:hypothetical protein